MTLEQIQKQEYQNSPAYTNFIESLSQSKATRRSYEQQLKKFMQFLRVDDPQLLLKWDSKVIESRIIDFVITCRKQGRAQQSIHCYYMTIKHFEINDIVLNWKKLKVFVGKANGKKANDRAYSHQEIHKLIDRAEPRMKICILLMCSAGLRLGALPYLSVGNLRKISLPSLQHHIYEITVTHNKGRPPYFTFCTPECATAIVIGGLFLAGLAFLQ
jgi:site-specific recombinase XerD